VDIVVNIAAKTKGPSMIFITNSDMISPLFFDPFSE